MVTPRQADRAAIEAASVIGLSFDGATVAAGIDRGLAETEALLTEMSKKGQIMRLGRPGADLIMHQGM